MLDIIDFQINPVYNEKNEKQRNRYQRELADQTPETKPTSKAPSGCDYSGRGDSSKTTEKLNHD